MRRWIMLLPLALFLLVAVFLYRGLYLTRPSCRRR